MRAAAGVTAAFAGALVFASTAAAQTTPTVVDPKLEVRTVTTGLSTPVQMQFIKDHEFWVLEKGTGQIKRVRNGGAPEVILDLPVNSNSERGLLGITLDKDFKRTGTLFLYWSESTTGADSTLGAEVPLLGNRLDRYHWDGSTLKFEATIHRGRALQEDATNRLPATPDVPLYRGNHNGGVLRTGPDNKIRRGHPGRPIRRPGHHQQPPDGRHPAPEPGRHDAPRQPVLEGRRRARRPGRGEPQEDLRLRPAQRLRHGVRPVQR
jgi:glucose/arabinose dehydrogenase